ncbi:acyl-coenzyme A thioesterase 1-like [Gastrophryne carolinensis]
MQRVKNFIGRTAPQFLLQWRSLSSLSRVQLQVLPERCLFDEPLRLCVSGLVPGQRVTLQTELTDERGELFTSLGLYQALIEGELDLRQSLALEGGSFSGIDPEGPLWSLEPQNLLRRLVKRNVWTPFQLHFSLWETGQPGALLATANQERSFLGEGVSRLQVREGRVQASLFLPPGPGPFPGVIEIQGIGGGLLEYKASLLASKGFATMALAYYNYGNLPKQLKDLHLEYFEEAVNYMLQHPKVKGPGIGLLGHSMGGSLALSMASFLKGISATVVVNGPVANIVAALHYKDITLPPIGFDVKKITYPFPGVADIRDMLNNPLEEANRQSLVPVGRADCKFLFLGSEDDGNWNNLFHIQTACKLLEEQGKEKPEVVYYAKAGHYIEPPYFPWCKSSMHTFIGQPVNWGGEPKSHCVAQVDSWKRIQAFFHKHLK